VRRYGLLHETKRQAARRHAIRTLASAGTVEEQLRIASTGFVEKQLCEAAQLLLVQSEHLRLTPAYMT
jgi:hypothetical protein